MLDQAISEPLRVLRLDSIRNKILAFAVLATLIPSLSTAWVSYTQNKRSLNEKITGELQSVSAETAREMDLWLKERLYDLRVFASSYEVSENVDRLSRGQGAARRRINDYLNAVQKRFSVYEELLVLDQNGHVVASSSPESRPVVLPATWLTEVRTDNSALGDPYWDEALGRVVLMAAVPIRVASGGRFVGALTAKLNLRPVDDILKRFTPNPSGQTYLTTEEGAVITSSRFGSTEPMRWKLAQATHQALVNREAETMEYRGLQDIPVAGSLRRIPRLNWSVVAEVPVREAYRQVIRLRNETALIVTALLAGVGLIGYILGMLIVRPLNRLIQAASAVAGGDLDVDLAVTTGGEVGYLTEVFNNMVVRLREGRQALDTINETLRKKNEELERLSVTDGLTKLYNRRLLMQRLEEEILRCRRHKRAFSVLMADVDHFKRYNDAYGHLAGDEVLTRVAAILRETTRDVDCAARYGGEEFVVVMAETPLKSAVGVSERVQERLAAELFEGDKITLSVGVAEFPLHGDTAEALIASADAAMYAAKDQGRDRVIAATKQPARETKKPA